MTISSHSIPIIRTKLNRPLVAPDFVHREGLSGLLAESPDNALILVSAPAGYGKTSAISHWLETQDRPNAWLSLDKPDGDIRTFLSYVVAAVQFVYPEACAETQTQLKEVALAPSLELSGSLCNDFDDLDQSFILVLDDYHLIDAPAVNELLNHLLLHPPPHLRLVIISRYDPSLVLGALRAHNNLAEIRMQDLKFTLSETTTFFEQTNEKACSGANIALLHSGTEGWPAGLRLAALALKHHSDPDAFLAGFTGELSSVADYLIEEILEQQIPVVQNCLNRTSILNRFCAPLCEAVCSTQCHEDAQTGCSFIQFQKGSGMLSVALDERGEWYRYHHLFQELLQQQIKDRLTPDEISGLHRRAASWFEGQGLLDDAFDHLLLADDPAAASQLIVRHRNDIYNGEQWYDLDRWMRRLPVEIIADDPEMLMLEAWRLRSQGRQADVLPVLDDIEELLSNEPHSSAATPQLRGSISALRSRQYYLNCQTDLALKCAEQALIELPPDCLSERGYALSIMTGVLRTNGELQTARKIIHDALADTSLPVGTFQCRILISLCLIDWHAPDLRSLRRTAKQCLKLSEELGLMESCLMAHFFLGIVHYQYNELAGAETSLGPVISNQRLPNQQYSTDSAVALASVYQARGQPDKARKTLEAVGERLLSERNFGMLLRVQAFQADLALRQGRMAEALSWAERFEPQPFENMYGFYEPRMTLARVLITQGSVDSHKQADSLLTRLETFVAGIHNTRFLIEVFALQALLHDARGDEPAALKALSRAISLARSGGFIRLFVDLGPGLARLLHKLDQNAHGPRYVGEILAAFRSDEKAKGRAAPAHSLTKRELEILQLMIKDLSNRQIAEQLYIATATVKRHNENLYHKLHVPDRHQAVAKAKQLGIFHSD